MLHLDREHAERVMMKRRSPLDCLTGLTRTDLETNLATFADDEQNVTAYTRRKSYPFKRH